MAKKQTYEEWLEEDAERINKMADDARKLGVTVPVDDPPELNDDGSYAESDDSE